jgi:ATP-dependent Zn protease
LAGWWFALLFVAAMWTVFGGVHSDPIDWRTIQQAVQERRVERIEVRSWAQTGTGTVWIEGQHFQTPSRPLDDFSALQARGATVTFSKANSVVGILTSLNVAPMIVVFALPFAVLLFRLYRSRALVRRPNGLTLSGGGPGSIGPNGQPPAEWGPTFARFPERAPLEGFDEAFVRLKAAADAARDRQPGPRRVLIVGQPGTQPSSLLEAVAADLDLPLLAVPSTQFVAPLTDAGAARVRKLFEKVALVPCIAAITDLDLVAAPPQPSDGEDRATALGELTKHLDGRSPLPKRAVFVATTSRPEILAEAALGPGRFDLRITLAANGGSTVEELEAEEVPA